MAFDIAVKTQELTGNEDRRWTGLRKGYDTCRSITLDLSTFAPEHLTLKGAIPSGIVLARITATGKYGPLGVAGSEGAAGFLFNTTPIKEGTLPTAADVGVPLMWEGLIKTAFLPAFTGTTLGVLDAGARTALPFFKFEDV